MSGITTPSSPVVADLEYNCSHKSPIIYDEDVISQALDLLFAVTPGTRFLMEGYGIDLESYVFRYDAEMLQHVIISEVVSQLKMYLPFVEIVWPASKVTQVNEYIEISITYKLASSTDLKTYSRFFQGAI